MIRKATTPKLGFASYRWQVDESEKATTRYVTGVRAWSSPKKEYRMAAIFIKWPRLSGVSCDASKSAGATAILKAMTDGPAVKLASNSKLLHRLTGWYVTRLDGFDRLLLQVIGIWRGMAYLPSKSMPSETLAALENPGSIG
jgi:hypothetical protein